MLQLCEFLVVGKPEPQGSTKAFVPLHPVTKQPYRRADGGIVVNVTSDNPNLKAWRQRVAIAARSTVVAPAGGPVHVHVEFYVKRPDGHLGTGRNAGTVKPSAPEFPIVRPDVDKLARGLLDALTGVVWGDDSQVVGLNALKRYAAPGESPGALVRVSALEEAPDSQEALFTPVGDLPAPALDFDGPSF